MREAMKTYFAIVHKEKDSAVGVVFPDLPGCFSAGDTYDAAIANAHVALRLYAEAERDAGRQLPKPRTFEALYRDREVREEARDAPFVGIRLEEHVRGAIGTKAARGSGKAQVPPSKRAIARDAADGTPTGVKPTKRSRKAG
jgi:predicted RNase H-like HicB family nuclease